MKAHSVPAFIVEQTMTITPYSDIIPSPIGENVANNNREFITVKAFCILYSLLVEY
jgi:hypothetical protein